MKTEKTFNFGKIDYYGKGRKINSVTVTMSYRDGVLSVSGDIWNGKHTDIVCGGQCLDEIAKYIHSSTFKKIHRLWKLYHLNDMRPYDEHQKALGWDKQAKEEVTVYRWRRAFNSCYTQARGQMVFDNCEEGLIGKPCPVCGYRYGSAWKREEIPDEDIKIIEELMNEGE